MHQEVLSQHRDIYEAITAKIVTAIESGVAEFHMPWHRRGANLSLPINAATNKPYHGVNVLALWIEASAEGYTRPQWATYRQWRSLGAQVRAGERGTVTVFFKQLEREEEAGEENTRPRFVGRAARVFNASQVDEWAAPMCAPPEALEEVAQVEAFIVATKATIVHGFDSACYRRGPDLIEMPEPKQFFRTGGTTAAENYYAVLLHELTHWSGAPHRLKREFGKRFGDEAYAFEELVAELGAAFLCAALGITNEPRPDHAAYVSSWLDILGRDRRAIFTAAKQAQLAADYLGQISRRQ